MVILDISKNYQGLIHRGATLEETKRNLIEAIQLVLEANRQLIEEEISEKETIKEPLGSVSI